MTCCELKLPKGAFHCVVCCNTFGRLIDFDRHQKKYIGGQRVFCRIPANLCRDRWGIWRTPDDKAALESRMGAMKEARHK